MHLTHAGRVLLVALALAPARAMPIAAQKSTLLTNGRVLQLDARGHIYSSVLIAGGRVVAFDDAAIARRGGAEVVDLRGATVMPALADHHVHLFNVGLWLLNDAEHERLFLDLSGVTSLEMLLRRVRDRAATAQDSAWVVGAGWNQAMWGEAAMPDALLLAYVAADHPVFLARSDGHAGWTNAVGLRRARIAGHRNGILLEDASEALLAALPSVSDADVRHAFRLGAEALAARGVAEVYDAGALAFPGVGALGANHARLLALLRAEDAAAPLPLRVNLMVPAPGVLADSLLDGPHQWTLSPRLRITHLKLFADGALGSRGAALTHPYADDAGTSGVARLTTPEIAALALRAIDAGLGVATHAIGDEAVRRTLDAYEAVIAARPRLVSTRLRIEHFSYAREEDLLRAARLGVLLSIQSGFNASADEGTPLGTLRVGAANEPRVYAWNRLAQLGAQLADGSDYFARPLEPLAGLQAALTRRHAIGADRPDSVARPLALWMQVGRRRGDGAVDNVQLRAGGPADLVVLSDDPLRVLPGLLARVQVLRTYNAGRLVFANKEAREAPVVRDTRDADDVRRLPQLMRLKATVAAAPFQPPLPLPPDAPPTTDSLPAPVCSFKDVGASSQWSAHDMGASHVLLRLPREGTMRVAGSGVDAVASRVPDLGVVALRVSRARTPDALVLDWRPVLWRTRCRVHNGPSLAMTWTFMDVEDAPEYGRYVAEGRMQMPDGDDVVIGLAVRDPALRAMLVATFAQDVTARGAHVIPEVKPARERRRTPTLVLPALPGPRPPRTESPRRPRS